MSDELQCLFHCFVLRVITVVRYSCLEGVMDVLVNIVMIKIDDVSGRCVGH